MNKTILLSLCCFVLMFVSGCSKSGDTLAKEQIAAMNDLAEAIEKDKSKDEIKKIENRMEKIEKEMEALNLSDDEKKKIVEKHKDEFIKAAARLIAAKAKGMKLPEFKLPETKLPGNNSNE